MFRQTVHKRFAIPGFRILGLLSAGETKESILKAYPYLEPQDIDESLAYAAYLADGGGYGVCMKFLVDMPASPNSLNGLMKKDMMLFTPRILAYIKQRTEKYLKKQGNTIGLLSLLTLISRSFLQ